MGTPLPAHHLQHGTAINQNIRAQNDPKPNPSDYDCKEPPAAGGAKLGEPTARWRDPA